MIIIGGVYVGGCMFIKGGCTCIKALILGLAWLDYVNPDIH